jgi:hypothetical protein
MLDFLMPYHRWHGATDRRSGEDLEKSTEQNTLWVSHIAMSIICFWCLWEKKMIQLITDLSFGVEYHVSAASTFKISNSYGRTQFSTLVERGDKVLVTQNPFLKVFVNGKEVYSP